eukprot:g14680.t1
MLCLECFLLLLRERLSKKEEHRTPCGIICLVLQPPLPLSTTSTIVNHLYHCQPPLPLSTTSTTVNHLYHCQPPLCQPPQPLSTTSTIVNHLFVNHLYHCQPPLTLSTTAYMSCSTACERGVAKPVV